MSLPTNDFVFKSNENNYDQNSKIIIYYNVKLPLLVSY